MSNGNAQVPILTGGGTIEVTRRVAFSIACPKCNRRLDVTDVAFGANIQCPDCKRDCHRTLPWLICFSLDREAERASEDNKHDS